MIGCCVYKRVEPRIFTRVGMLGHARLFRGMGCIKPGICMSCADIESP
jgi:hypothetical protein